MALSLFFLHIIREIYSPYYERSVIGMVIFTLLLLITLVLVVITAIVISVGGAVGIILFSDVIVCIVILVWLMKKIFKKK